MSRRYELRFRAPDRVDGYDVHTLGEERPPFVVVVKLPRDEYVNVRQIVWALNEAHGEKLNGSPIVVIPAGSEFEVWEVGE